MFTTIDSVKNLTGYDVDNVKIIQAQGIIEIVIGRTESNVEDVDDLEIIGRATAYQAAYMKDNAESVFSQIGVKQIAQTDGYTIFTWEQASPFVAPLAWMCLRSLSWKGHHSVHTGAILDSPRRDYATWWRIH